MKYTPELVGSKFRIPTLRKLEKAVERAGGELPIAVGHLVADQTIIDRVDNGVYAVSEKSDEFGEGIGAWKRFFEGFKEGSTRGGMIVHQAGVVCMTQGLFGRPDFEYTRTHEARREDWKEVFHPPEIIYAVDRMEQSVSEGGFWGGFEQDRLGYSRRRTITPFYHDGFNGVEHTDVVFDLAALREATVPITQSTPA